MPQIIVMADKASEDRDRAVMFTERVNESDFESGHFRTQLAERLGWAVADAHDAEQQAPEHRTEVDDEAPEVTGTAEEPQPDAADKVERRELSAVLG